MTSRWCLLGVLLLARVAGAQTFGFTSLAPTGDARVDANLQRLDTCLAGLAGVTGAPTKCTSATGFAPGSSGAVLYNSGGKIAADLSLTTDGNGALTLDSLSSTCNGAQNLCGANTAYNTSDCLAPDGIQPGTNTGAECLIDGLPHQHLDADTGARLHLVASLGGRSGNATQVVSSTTKTDLSTINLRLPVPTGRTLRAIFTGTMQVNGGGTFDYFVTLGQSGAPSTVLDITGSPTLATASTAYRVTVTCAVRDASTVTAATVECNGCWVANGVTALCAEANTANVDLSGAPILKSQVKFGTSDATNNLTEKIVDGTAGDPRAIQ